MKQKLKNKLLKINTNIYVWIPKKQTQKIDNYENTIHIHYPVYFYCN